ncbi:MAG: hypothetical protein E6Q88_04325 [Lysobacteraceae bacterium]|nr:MAG: hypothetical protein E6Q88_04325 [Xanthomonadaceae bacterium]
MAPAVRVAVKLCIAVAAMPASIVAAHLIDLHEVVEIICGVVFAVALASAILYMLDLRQALLEIERPSLVLRTFRVLIAFPQALLGLVALGSGLAIIAWVLYNSFVERLPEYTGGFMTFGVSSLMVLFGFGLLRDAFSRSYRPGERPPIS